MTTRSKFKVQGSEFNVGLGYDYASAFEFSKNGLELGIERKP
jgi:hypothetical protein